DAWVAYIDANRPLSPSFARRAVVVDGAGQEVDQGDTLTFDVAGLDLTSLGSPQNTTLSIAWEGSASTFADVPVTDGAATVAITVPDDVTGPSVIVLTASPSGTTVRVPVIVSDAPPPGPPPWSPGATYDAGDQVTYEGRVFEATWWTREVPGANPWGSWQEIATAPDGTAIWTPSRIFDTGDVALYD